jgi:hypothetical protein
MDLRCETCGETAVLEREWLGHGSHYRWLLVENGDEDQP